MTADQTRVLVRRTLWGLCGAAAMVGSGLVFWYESVPEKVRVERTKNEYRPVPCEVTRANIVEDSDDDGTSYCPHFDFFYKLGAIKYTIHEWAANECWFGDREDASAVVRRFPAGQALICWYDPLDPAKGVLEKNTVYDYSSLVAAMYLLFGGLVFLMTGARYERYPRVVRGANRDVRHIRMGTGWRLWVALALAPYGLTVAAVDAWIQPQAEVWEVILAVVFVFAAAVVMAVRSGWTVDLRAGRCTQWWGLGHRIARREYRLSDFDRIRVNVDTSGDSTSYNVQLVGRDNVTIASPSTEFRAQYLARRFASAFGVEYDE